MTTTNRIDQRNTVSKSFIQIQSESLSISLLLLIPITYRFLRVQFDSYTIFCAHNLMKKCAIVPKHTCTRTYFAITRECLINILDAYRTVTDSEL